MNMNSTPPTAKIYQFPLSTSPNLGKSQWRRTASAAADSRQIPLPTVEFGSGWYHEAALETDRPRKS